MACFTDDLGHLAFELMFGAFKPVKRGWFASSMDVLRGFNGKLPQAPAFISERTSLEKTLLVAGTVWVTWKMYDWNAHVLVGKVFQGIVPGYRWVMRRVGTIEKVFEPVKSTQRTMLESRRQGSEESLMTMPRAQVQIGYKRDGQLVIIGCAIRFQGDWMIAPDHVVGGDGVEFRYASGLNGSIVSLAGKERILLDTDLVAIALEAHEWARLGVAVCKIANLSDSGCFGQVVGPESKGTTGTLKHDPTIFGRVTYSGTTLGGYSGAAYMSGAAVVGIHQMGGLVNGGYSASYAWCKLRQATELKFEASDDWLLGQFRAGNKIIWSEYSDPDYVQVRVSGEYSTVKRSNMNAVFGTDWKDSHEIQRTGDRMSYGDKFESADFAQTDSLQSLGASSSLDQPESSKELSVLDVMAEYLKLSPKRQRRFRQSLSFAGKQSNSTAGQENSLPTQN